MGDFDCYCFLCSGPLFEPQLGSASPQALRKRRQRVEEKRLALKAGLRYVSDSSESEDGGEEENEDDEEIDEYEERTSYDPELATEERTDWIQYLRVLGFNPNAIGGSKAWISGRARYDDGGVIEVFDGSGLSFLRQNILAKETHINIDPNQPSLDENRCYDCYVPTNGNEVVFPFHSSCMAVLKKVYEWSLNSSSYKKMKGLDSTEIDMDSLYDAATDLCDPYAVYLKLKYGDISGAEQCWECHPGEEYSVTDPLHSAVETIELPPVSTAFQSLYSRLRSSVDPFGAVPNEVIHSICTYLPGEDLSNFLMASFVAHCATLDPTFWKSLGRSRMPWAWELWERTSRHDSQLGFPIDYKKLYFLVDAHTSLPFGITRRLSGWMGLANRRRIWTTCLLLLPHYFRSLQGGISDNKSSSDITDAAIEGELFPISYPPASSTASQTFVLHSWEELHTAPSIFEAYWDLNQNLVGLGTSSGIQKRILGRGTGSQSGAGNGITKSAGRINTGEWIQSLSLGLEILQPLHGTAVKRVDVTLTSGRKITLGDGRRNFAKRQFLCFNGYTFAGLFGQTGHNGVIGSLGILQCPTPKTLCDIASPKLSTAERLLWHHSSSSIVHNRDVKLRSLVVLEDSSINALTPHETFSWTAGAEQFSKLERISARLCTVLEHTGILQLQCRFVRRFWEPKRGLGRNSGDVSEELLESEDTPVHHFDIDGPGGERVIGVKAQGTNDRITAITLCTNQGRQATFGQETQDKWNTFEETGEEFIFGLAAGFSLSADPHEKHFSLMNSIIVLTKKQD